MVIILIIVLLSVALIYGFLTHTSCNYGIEFNTFKTLSYELGISFIPYNATNEEGKLFIAHSLRIGLIAVNFYISFYREIES